jgi:YebC/PmpR family DNA-binding regulatory protein
MISLSHPSKQLLFSSLSHRSHRSSFTTHIVAMGRKSAKIAMKKGKTDAAKAKLYGKFGKMIAQEARSDPDPASNPRLKDVVAQAKAAQVPADIIERNLKKGSESKSDYQEMVYEAYGLGGTGFIIEALTDNVNRTAAEVRTAVTKSSGKMADSGSVLFNFSRTGLVMVSSEEDEDATFEAAIEAGATDVESSEEGYRVLTSLEDYAMVQGKLVESGLKINAEVSGLVYVPLVTKAEDELMDEDFEANEAMLERLMEVDDVDAVYKNY